jgi:hypothetical protein
MYVIYDLDTGIVDRVFHGPKVQLNVNVYEGQGFIEVKGPEVLVHPEYSYVENGEWVWAPDAPPHHEWDWPTRRWLPNLDAARGARLQEVAAELGGRLYLPCNGFDADKTARERINGMIARLQRGDGLPAGWVGWRDAANEMRWVDDDPATVLANLTALSRAIEDREQALLVASWTHKANIAALTDIDTILSYDVTANWPV